MGAVIFALPLISVGGQAGQAGQVAQVAQVSVSTKSIEAFSIATSIDCSTISIVISQVIF